MSVSDAKFEGCCSTMNLPVEAGCCRKKKTGCSGCMFDMSFADWKTMFDRHLQTPPTKTALKV